MQGTNFGAASKEDGSYKINDIIKGRYNLIISAIGYETKTKAITIDKNIDLDVILTP